MSISAVILCGGSGSRLWPISHDMKPKQFLTLLGEHSMLQQTVARVQHPLFDPKTIFITASSQSEMIGEKMARQDHVIIGEPCRRNTAAAAVAAALYVAENNPDNDLMLLVPADHVITSPAAFHEAVSQAKAAAERGYIVTFGIHPETPETGYGYIKRGETIAKGIYKISEFKEKPDEKTARKYCESGEFDWNSGIFLFSAKKFLAEIGRFEPEILKAVKSSYESAERIGNLVALDEENFGASPSNSIDYAVMERTDQAAVLPCDFGWSDLGSYRSLYDIRTKLKAPCHPADAELLNSKDCLVVSDGPQVNIVGLDNIGVIVDQGRVLVLNLDASQDVKQIADIHKKSPA
ncbi:mannose-1-phosphate guanylyltransferase [Litorimonas haliclonae]|uniref:mannose-1-phosphate guanylyltransferase n=1 Tax=Litorimonas haliclonae TaxID=2081977 RepID=UPI0039EEEF83